jgi:hypothetical protein
LVGATVRVVGANSGTITDMDGHFTLNVKPSAKLNISYIGFQTTEVTASDKMLVKLADGKELDEVVVTGYQVQRKADLTGAVAVMDMKEPVGAADPNILNSMQGKLSGVNIVTDAAPGGGSTTIRVRGISTVNSSDPLLCHRWCGNGREPQLAQWRRHRVDSGVEGCFVCKYLRFTRC